MIDKEGKMKAEIYRLTICDSGLHSIHGMTREICEMYIPEMGIAYNSEACFEVEDDSDRYNNEIAVLTENVDIPECICEKLKSYIDAKQKLDKVGKWFDDVWFKKDFDFHQERETAKQIDKMRDIK